MTFSPGVPFPESKNPFGIDYTGQAAQLEKVSLDFYIKAFFGLILIFTVILGGYFISKKIPWKLVLKTYMLSFSWLLGFVVLCGVVLSFLKPENNLESLPFEPPVYEITPQTDEPSINQMGMQGFDLNLLVTITLAIMGLLIIILAVNWYINRGKSDDPLRMEAELALQAIQKGSDLKGVIIHCYRQMSQALQDEQGLEMEEAMTAREFERLLAERGVPNRPVAQLTSLFESARYSLQQPTPGDEKAAVESLNAIVQYTKKRAV